VSPYDSCVLCPRRCGAARSRGEPGFCGQGASVRAASALLHFGEEPPITGTGGSGTVFFTGCTLQCRFCQNWQVSSAGAGAELTDQALAGIFLELQGAGAENINAVTGTHFIPGILGALRSARGRGLHIPLVWNSSGYETPEAVQELAPEVRFFLPDLKSLDAELSARWLRAADYPRRACEALLAMARARPLVMDENGPREGMIVRHLVLPGNLAGTRAVLEWFAGNLTGRALISLMFQYTPIPGRELPAPFHRMVSPEEYRAAVDMLEELGIDDGYYQEPETGPEWLPDFTRARPFASGRSTVIWHFAGGAAQGDGRPQEDGAGEDRSREGSGAAG
jgi:putative pyruvate formate lyase activating enzyme